MRLAYLESVVKNWSNQPSSEPEEIPLPPGISSRKPSAFKSPISVPKSTVLKSCVALALALLLGWTPVQRLLATTSADAVINARVVTLRAPIEGEVSFAVANTDIGTELKNNQIVLTIQNPRFDTSRLDTLHRDRDKLNTAVAALEGKLVLLTSSLGELSAQQERFRLGRIAQLEQRVRESDSDIASAKAQNLVASDALNRARLLKQSDTVSQAFLDKAIGDENVARQAVQGAIERRKGILVELDGAKKGTFIGDSYNDTPQSAQRKMEVALELADVRARLEGSKLELAAIEANVANETRRQDALSHSIIQSTVKGRIWEMLTASGEHVNAGQDLFKMLDCGSAFVTASVSETAYQNLAVGQKATFTPRGSGSELQGWITGLAGLAAVTSNSAIQQSVLSREPYHVTLKFPDLAHGAECQVGRSGLVRFDTTSPVVVR
jgi:biotin carboxyl carrier protein